MFYGDYPEIAKRLLDSLDVHDCVKDFRFGLNQVGTSTRDYIHNWAFRHFRDKPVYCYEESSGSNLGKYPILRQMLRDRPLADRVMWFDDDSYVDPAAGANWWRIAADVSNKKIQVGAVHFIMQRNRQHEVIVKQPWFTGKSINKRHRFEFVTGGWWIANSEFLLKWDYPFPALYHNGGDSILGELIRQQNGKLINFSKGIQCHCENCVGSGNHKGKPVVHINTGGRKGRRGLGVRDERYVWEDGNSFPALSHQNFNMTVSRYEI